jgi:predicted nucleic acid-binding protein
LILIDTNILAYLMIEGDRTSAAQTLFASDSDWASESFILVEFTNVLTTYVRTKALTHKQALEMLAEAQAVVPTLTNVQHSQAFETATEFGISAYDGRFIAIAKQTKSKLVTEDGRLRAAVPAWTIALGDVI